MVAIENGKMLLWYIVQHPHINHPLKKDLTFEECNTRSCHILLDHKKSLHNNIRLACMLSPVQRQSHSGVLLWRGCAQGDGWRGF